MVILSSAIAVVVAAVLLLLWVVVDGGDALIYAAMACAVVSIVLLQLGTRLQRPRNPEPDAVPSSDLLVEPRPAAPGGAVPDETADAEGPVADVSAFERFPIADYDALWVSQIVPLVAALDADALAVVEARERRGRARSAVLEAIAAVRPVPEADPEPAGVGLHEAEPDPEPDLDLDLDPEPGPEPDLDPVPIEVAVEEAAVDEVAALLGPDDGWDGLEPDQWDWSGVRGAGSGLRSGSPDPLADDDAGVDLDADQADVEPDEAATVRLFLGRRRSPVTVRRT